MTCSISFFLFFFPIRPPLRFAQSRSILSDLRNKPFLAKGLFCGAYPWEEKRVNGIDSQGQGLMHARRTMDLTPFGRVVRNERGAPHLPAPSIVHHCASTNEYNIPLPASSLLLIGTLKRVVLVL